MKLTKSYQNVTLESAITKDQLKKITAHCPESLILKNEDKKPVFAIEVGSVGCITNGGIRFDGVTAADNLFVTVCDKDMPVDSDKARAYLEDTFGTILAKLNRVEAQTTTALADLATEIGTVADSIAVD